MDKIHAKATLGKAISFLISEQKPDGSWPGENFAGPAYTAMCLCIEATIGILSDQDAAQGSKYCLSTQFPNGSYPDYETATDGSLSTTALIYAALKLTGLDDQSPAQLSALNFIQQHGGFESVDFEYKLYLVMADLYDAKKLKSPSIYFKLIPGSQRLLGSRFGLEMAIASNELPLMINGLKNGPGINFWRCPLNAIASRLALNYLLKTQNPAGNWAGILMPTLWALLCMHYMEIPKTNPAWIKACNYLDRWKVYGDQGMRVLPYQSENWNTALSVRALLFSKLEVAKSSIEKGLGYLLENQSNLPEPTDWQNPAPGAPNTGGWPYGKDNPLCADCDTTAAVLWTLAEARKQGYELPEKQVEKALSWLLPMQNNDGGWAAFAHGLKSKPPGPLFEKPLNLPVPTIGTMIRLLLNPPVEMGDPATEGLTGRVLCALGALGKNSSDPEVSNAINFIHHQTASNGAWWGRWEVNFLAATGCVISGLKAVGLPSKTECLSSGINWMLSKQNQDGGWGETIGSYRQPDLAGEGVSCGMLTGRVLSALLDSESESTNAVQKGFAYLCEAQKEDGSWPELYPLYVMVPPNSFYSNRIYSQYSPIEALAKYCRQE